MKHTSFKVAVLFLAVAAMGSCKKNNDKVVATAAGIKFTNCQAPKKTVSSSTLQHKATAAGGNFVAIGPNPGTGTPYFHGVSGGTFPLTPTPSPGGDNIIRDAASFTPLNNVTGIATMPGIGACFVLSENISSPGTWEVWKFPLGDPNNANLLFTVSGGGTSLSDLELDYNYSASPGSTRFLALDRSNNALIEIDWAGNVGVSTGYYTSTFPLPASEVVTGLAWFNCLPSGPGSHSHPFLLSHDASGAGHIWKCTDNTLENGWPLGAADYTGAGPFPTSPTAEFGIYFDHSSTLHFVLANDNPGTGENTEAIPVGGPGTPFYPGYAGSTDPIIDMAEF